MARGYHWTVAVCAALFSVAAFATDYTWTGGGGDDHGWRTPANWGRTDNKYPVSGDRAIFLAGCMAEVELGATNNYEAVSQVRIMAGATVRFYAADPTATTRLDLKDKFEWSYDNITVEFDHIQIDGSKAVTPNAGARITLKNGSLWYVGDFNVSAAAGISLTSGSKISSGKGHVATGSAGTAIVVDGAEWTTTGGFTLGGNASVSLLNGAAMNTGDFTISASATSQMSLSGRSALTVAKFTIKGSPDSLLSIDDSTVTAKSDVILGDTAPGGGHFVFKGTRPVFRTTGNPYFKPSRNNADMISHFDFDFEVPEGGFAEVPLQHVGSQFMRDNANVPADYCRFNVLESSPALSAGTTTDCPLLFSVQTGMVRAKVSNGDQATATMRFSDMSGTVEATSDGSAKALYATIGSGDPAAPNPAAHGALSTYTKTSVVRNAITAYGYAAALAGGGDTTRVELWCGTVNNAASMAFVDAVTPTILGEFSATYTAPENIGEVTHYFQWRLFDIGAGGVTNYTDVTDVFNATTKDTTTYTWQAVNGDWNGDWTDAAHWSSDYASANGYPNSSSATAVFPAGHPLIVTISANSTVGTLDLTATKELTDAANARGVEITFKGAAATGTNCVLTASMFNVKSALGTITLDNAAVKVSGSTTIEPVSRKTVRLVNGSDFYSNPSLALYDGGILEATGRSTMSVNGFYIGNADSRFVIDDSRFAIRGESNFGAKSVGGTFVFKGANPILAVGGNALYFAGNNASKMIFEVPAAGYDEPIIRYASNTYDLFRKNGKTATLTFSIDPNSPFYSTVGTLDLPLVVQSGSKAIDQSNLVYADVANGGYFMLGTSATDPYGFADVALFSGTAKSLGVHLVSIAHDGRLDVASDAPVELDGYSPALGTAAASGSITATAPAPYVADGVRYSCTGYTLTEYVAGTADTVSGTPTEASGSSVTFTLPAGGAKIEWHYATDYVVAATAVNDANGVVAKSADYVSASSPVTLTASTTSPGMEFQYWYGDVAWSNRYDNPVTVSGDKAKDVYAFFGATAANAATRTLSYSGNTGKEWFNTSHWADGVIPGTNDTAVLINTSTSNLHQGLNKGRVIVPSFVAVGNLVVSNAVLFVGAQYGCVQNDRRAANSSPAIYQTDQNGNHHYWLPMSADKSRTEPVGLDIFGDVMLDSHDYGNGNGNSGGAIFVGGADELSCNVRVDIKGDLDIVNGSFSIAAGYPFDFVPDVSKAQNKAFTDFGHKEEFFRGGNYLKVGGKTRVRTATANKVYNFIHVANDFRTGVPVWLDLKDVEIDEGASITSILGGFAKFTSAGAWKDDRANNDCHSTCPGGHSISDCKAGGSHGGLGGREDASNTPTDKDTTYDYELTPMYPGNDNAGNGHTAGGGSIRIDCATLELDGGLIASGVSGKGGSAGGSIWVICDAFNFGDNCQVFADGGNRNAGGGGGRISICEGLTPEQAADLFATHEAPQDVIVTDLADKLGARVSVAGGTGVTGSYSPGYPGTAFYLVNTAGKRTLTVAGNPANLGSPTPAYGPQIYDDGEVIPIAAPETAYVTDDNRSRRVAVGYTITDTETGDVVADESETSDSIAITGDWTLTWQLTTLQHALDISAATTGGTITTNAIDAADSIWQDDGSALSVTAVPASGFRFAGWMGEIDEAVQYDATFSTNVTGALRVAAAFVSDDADTATWTGGGDGVSFLDAANWSTGKVPGSKSDVVIGSDAAVTSSVGLVFNVKSLSVASGASLVILPEGSYATTSWDPRLYPESVALYDWHDCGVVASGDITVAGTLVAGRRDSAADAKAVAGGALTISEGASVTVSGGYRLDLTASGAKGTPALWRVPSALVSAGGAMTVGGTLAIYGERLSGSPCKVAAGTLAVGATGVLHSNGGGWGRSSIGGVNVYYSYNDMGDSYNGGAYGGFGGGYSLAPASVTQYGNLNTYGEALRPYLPGSQGGNNTSALGGGTLRIEVAGSLRNGGTISANGKNVGYSTGGGAGGAVWISCSKFTNEDGAALFAKGGNNSGNGGSGGGGRILVCEKLDAAKIDALYATGVVPAKVTATEITDANRAEFSAGAISADGGTNINNSATYPCWSGTAGSIWWLRGRGLGTFIMVR